MTDEVTADPGSGGAKFAGYLDGSSNFHPLTRTEFGAGSTSVEVADVDGQRLPVKEPVLHTDLAAILAKLTSDPATQTTLTAFMAANHTDLGALATLIGITNGDLGTTLHADLAAILAKQSSDPATQITLAAILAKIIASPATEAKQDSAITQATATNTAVGVIGDAAWASGNGSVIAVLKGIFGKFGAVVIAAGSAIIGKVGIDQTTPGTTDSVSVATAQGAGATIGTTSGTAVITDANGTIQQYLRGLVKLWIAGLAAGEAHVGEVGGKTIIAGTSVTRPADTTAYASGDLIANSTTAGSVTPLSLTLGRVNQGTGMIRRARLKANKAAWINTVVRVHFYRDSPTCANGDNGAWSTTESNYLGAIDITLDKAFSDPFSKGIGVPNTGSEINFDCASASTTIYALLEARSAITTASGDVISLAVETLVN